LYTLVLKSRVLPSPVQLAESAKLQFSCREYSDHLAIVHAYDGWREAERDRNGYDYCWRNFLSAQTLKALDSLRRQFIFLLKDTGLIDENMTMCNKWSRDANLVRAVICAGLYPGVSSVVVSCFYINFYSISCIVSSQKCFACKLLRSYIRAILILSSVILICFLYTQNKEKSVSLKTMEDGQVMLYSVSYFIDSVHHDWRSCCLSISVGGCT
jgi:hypothetical protein